MLVVRVFVCMYVSEFDCSSVWLFVRLFECLCDRICDRAVVCLRVVGWMCEFEYSYV